MTPRAVLVGAPGAGKSTVGRILAERIGVDFHDTDAAIERDTSSSVADLFVSHGEAYFRELERAEVARAVGECTGVVAIGGGAVLDEGTRKILVDAPTVWLRVGLSDALARVGMNQARPLLLGNVRGTLLKMLQDRTPLYEEVASITVDTDGLAPADIADKVQAAWIPLHQGGGDDANSS